MIGTTMTHMLLFILQFILCYVIIHTTHIPRTEAYIHPRAFNHTIIKTDEVHPSVRVHHARRCHDDCSLIEFKGDY
jgi:hypothetical protein